MPRYVLDTQHYIDVLRDRPKAIRKRINERFKPHRLIVPDAADFSVAGDAIRTLAGERDCIPSSSSATSGTTS